MAYSRFETAQWDGVDKVTVGGPIRFAEDERGTTVVTSLNFVLVQGDEFVPGSGSVDGKGDWGGVAEGANKFGEGPAQGFGVAVLVTRPQPATPEPVVQMLTWSEAITITK
jgi:hypothetical protein